MIKHYKDLKRGDLIYVDSVRYEVILPVNNSNEIVLFEPGVFPIRPMVARIDPSTPWGLLPVYAHRETDLSIPF